MRPRTYSFSFIISIFILHAIFVSAADAANKIMSLGDSIVQGSSSGVVGESNFISYRKVLYDKLKTAGYAVNDEIFVGTLISGESVADFDPDHEGHGGWTTDEIVNGRVGEGKLADWLTAEEPNIVLLHIGTNDIGGNNEDWNEIEDIMVVIDDYESTSGKSVWVFLSLIIDRSCDPLDAVCLTKSARTNTFNNDVRNNVFFPRQAFGDKIVLVNMQTGAGINYDLWSDGGDMWDELHPFEFGYEKMANLYFSELLNFLPQADAGPDQNVNELDPVDLDGSGSTDPKNGTLSYQWVQTAGTNVVLSDAQAEQPTFDAPAVTSANETLTFTLTVTDDDELVSTDTMDTVVQAIAPQANAGVDQDVTESAPVTLDGTGSTGRNITYLWTPPAGVTLTGETTAAPTFTAPDVAAAGGTLPLTFQLTVTDDHDPAVTSSDTVVVTVADLQAVAGDDQNVTVGATVALDGTASTGPVDSYDWIQTAGTLVQLVGSDTATPSFTAPRASDITAAVLDTLTFQLTVKDNTGLESIDTVSVNVDDGTTPSTGGGGGGGGGCFISAAADGSPMALHGRRPGQLRSQLTEVNWKRLMAGNISLLNPRAEHAATLALVVIMAMLISSCAAIVLRKPHKKWSKICHHDRPKPSIFSKKVV